jgi:hypothetical protein
MQSEPNTFTRREVLLRLLNGTTAAAVVAPIMVQAAAAPTTSSPEPEFVPENDYPLFGYEHDALA